MLSRSSRSRPPLERICHIDRELRAHAAPNCSTLAAELGVSVKTIRRDIEYMRDRMGLPIAYDEAEHAYHYTAEVTSLPAVPVTEGEVLALFVASQALGPYGGTPFEAPLRSAFAKLATALRHEFGARRATEERLQAAGHRQQPQLRLQRELAA